MQPKTINLKIAANDKLVEIETRNQQQIKWIATTIIITASSLIGITLPTAMIIIIYIGWNYFKDQKEIKRMREKYGL
jgi:hypothetical protein